MQRKLVTTDELLKQLYAPDPEVQLASLKHRKKKYRQFLILWGIVILAVLHLLYLAIPMVIGVSNTINFIGYTRVIGIAYFEGPDLDRPGNVVVIGRYDISEIDTGDHVMVYGLLDTEYYWEVEIQSYNNQSETFTASFNGITEDTYDYEDIVGSYERQANIFGFISYVSSQWKGFLAIIAVYGSVILVYHILVFREMKIVERKPDDE